MKQSEILWFFFLIIVFFLGSGCPKFNVVCEDGETRDCFCPDGTQKVQSCMAEGSGWELCPCGIGEAISDEGVEWCDPDTGLCWQDPPYQKGRGLCWKSANDYCEQLVFDGHDDWWLPNITELRTLVVDCPQIEVGGACQIEDGSGWNDMDIENCTSCGSDLAYSANDVSEGCYWHASLHGLCNRVSVDPDVEFWSSSPNVDDPAHWAAFIHFGRGIMGFNHTVSWGDVRCVRNKTPDGTSRCEPNDTLQCTCVDSIAGAKKCSSDGSGWGDCVCIAAGETFKNECATTPTIDPDDCNKISVTVTAPDDFPGNPSSLMGFIYASDRCCPPNGPPEGGWNIYKNPELTADKPFVMDIHAINIAKTECLSSGEYKIFLSVLVNEDDPLMEPEWVGFMDVPVRVDGNIDGGEIELTRW